MWNDGPAKQPWLNYFNEYELQHCCFGGDGEDGEGGGEGLDEAYSTSRQGTSSAATSAAQSAASAADAMSGQNTAGGVGIDDDPDSLTADQAAAAAAAADAAAAAGLGGEAQQAAADAVAAEEMGIGIGDVAGGLAGANVSMQDIDALEDLGLIGYNERTDLGYFDKLDADVKANAEAKAAQVQADLRSRPGFEDEVVSINPVTGDFEYSSFTGGLLGAGQGLADLYGEFGLPAIAKDVAKGLDITKAGSDFVDSIRGIFSGNPSARQTLSTKAGSDNYLSGRAGIGEFRGGLKGEKGSEGYVSPQAVQAQLSKEKADRDAAATANQYATDVLGIDRDAQAYRDELATTNQYATDVLGLVDRDAQAYRDALADMNRNARNRAAIENQRREDIVNVLDLPSLSSRQVRGINSPFGGPRQTEADRRRDALEKVRAEIEEEKRRQANLVAVEDMLKYRSAGGMVYKNKGGQAKEKSAMELYLEKLGQPSKYTVPDFPMNRPSMTAPPTSSDPFELAEYRKNLARETMGSYLPVDIGGASSAINTFNEDYYGGASNVSPYNVAQLASIYGLDRNPSTYEGIIGMLGGVRNEPPPPPPEPDPEPEPVIVEEEDDDNWSYYDEEEIDNMGYLKGGGGIRNVLYRN